MLEQAHRRGSPRQIFLQKHLAKSGRSVDMVEQALLPPPKHWFVASVEGKPPADFSTVLTLMQRRGGHAWKMVGTQKKITIQDGSSTSQSAIVELTEVLHPNSRTLVAHLGFI